MFNKINHNSKIRINKNLSYLVPIVIFIIGFIITAIVVRIYFWNPSKVSAQPQNPAQETTLNTQQAQKSQFSVSNENIDKPPNYDAFINQAPIIHIEGNNAGSTIPVIPASTV